LSETHCDWCLRCRCSLTSGCRRSNWERIQWSCSERKKGSEAGLMLLTGSGISWAGWSLQYSLKNSGVFYIIFIGTSPYHYSHLCVMWRRLA
jgi:hypothetical protein